LDQEKVPIENLDEVPIPGNVKILGNRDRCLGGNMRRDCESLRTGDAVDAQTAATSTGTKRPSSTTNKA
jgi:hypothetical protein